ncbi:hypothetical protein [Sinomonas sp. G460-2]|uniref:COG4315 family predicted lipoprotein n=1 Tax=Sinomonas sp. G460-2 TaxID=3393464 RepID=UPI0039EFECB8
MNQRAALVWAALSAASALALAGCGANAGSGSSSSSAPPASSSAPSSPSSSSPAGGSDNLGYGYGGGSSQSAPAAAGLTLKTATVAGHVIVVDGKGTTVYVYTRDNPGTTTSACTGGCATLWPAVTSDATPALQGVTGKIGSIKTASGKSQVTINGMPIYYYSKDTAPGQTNGQGVASVWYVVGADGNMIQAPLAAAGSGY